MNSNNRLRVKFIHCGNRNISNSDDHQEKSIFYMPMGLFSMAGLLKQNGFDVEILHLDLENAGNIDKILDINTLDAVGLDCHWANQALVVTDTAKLLKKLNPGVFVFLGGYTAGFFANEILSDYQAVDAVVRGDGEIPVLHLCKTLYEYKAMLNRGHPGDGGKRIPGLENVPNLTWKGENGDINVNDLSYVSTSRQMNRFDFAAVDLLRNWKFYRDLCKYWTTFDPISSSPLFMLEMGRGCPYTCSTCGGNAAAQELISNRRGQVVRSVDSVIASIKKALRFGFSCFLTCFEFEDSDRWYVELFSRIKKEKLKVNFVYESWGIPSKVLINTLSHNCGHALITISPESADPELRLKSKDKRKYYTNRQLESCLEYIGTKGNLNVQLYFGYFLPFDTSTTIFKTIKYITKLYRDYSHFTEFFYMNFNTDPCSSLFLDPGKYKIASTVRTFDDYINKLKENYITANKERPAMTLLSWPSDMAEQEAVDLANKIYLFSNLFYFKNSMRYLLENVSETDILAGHLKGIDLSYAEEKDFTLDKRRRILLDICRNNLPADMEIISLISKEYELISYSRSLKKNIFSFFTIQGMNGAAGNVPGEDESKILSIIKENKEKITVDLNLD